MKNTEVRNKRCQGREEERVRATLRTQAQAWAGRSHGRTLQGDPAHRLTQGLLLLGTACVQMTGTLETSRSSD